MPETTPETSQPPTGEIEPISPEAARDAIETAIIARLGADWRADDTWAVLHDGGYLVRLTNGKINLDFQADLLGQVEVSEREISPVQASGRLVAWMVLGASLFVALTVLVLAQSFLASGG